MFTDNRQLVFAHCDLLSGNVIIQPRPTGPTGTTTPSPIQSVSFIDYEYAAPSPAAFDLLPTRSQRLDFIREYIRSYFAHLGSENSLEEEEVEAKQLFDEIDIYRGIPGFYWGIWALIQATISQIDFDYASYAEIRLGEYWAWRAETEGSRAASGKEMPLRERRWAQES